MMRTILYGRAVLADRILDDAALVIEGGRFLEIGNRKQVSSASAEVVFHDGLILPGFVDLHTHGGRGADFMDGTADAFLEALACHSRHGTTSLVPTSTVADHATMLRFLAGVRRHRFADDGLARVLGAHFYGPYFAPRAVGCHPADNLRDPIPAEYLEYLEFGDSILLATVAPELAGAESFARECSRRGIRVNLGHSHCTFDQARQAIGWGAKHVDHLFCAMSDRAKLRQSQSFPMRGGLMEATLYSDELTTEVIADGCHLDASLLKLAFRVKGPDRLALVSDASRALDLPDGEYIFGPIETGQAFLRRGQVGVTLAGDNVAGSVMGMDHMVRTFFRLTGSSLPEVIRMASLTPARIVGWDHEIGSIEAGKRADIVLASDELEIQQVWRDGRPLGRGQTLERFV